MNKPYKTYTIEFTDQQGNTFTVDCTDNVNIKTESFNDECFTSIKSEKWDVVKTHILYSTETFLPIKDLKEIENKDQKYTQKEKDLIFDVMRWALKEITGRSLRESIIEILVEDFTKEI